MSCKPRREGLEVPVKKSVKKVSFLKRLRGNIKKLLTKTRRFIDENSQTITRALGIAKDIATIIVIIKNK